MARLPDAKVGCLKIDIYIIFNSQLSKDISLLYSAMLLQIYTRLRCVGTGLSQVWP